MLPIGKGVFKIDLNKEMINDIISEELYHYLNKELIVEFGMNGDKFGEVYFDVLNAIVENLVSICLYPDNPTVPHWRGRAAGLCKKLCNTDLVPLKRNKADIRFKILKKQIVIALNQDYSALENHFKSINSYYSHRDNPHDNLIPYVPWNQAYEENKGRVVNAINVLTNLIAEQDYDRIKEFMNDF